MRVLSAICSWLLWLICFFYVSALTYVRATNWIKVKPQNSQLGHEMMRNSWIVVISFAVVAGCLLVIRRHLFFISASRPKPVRPVGFLFFVIAIVFYLAVLAVIVTGFFPYFFLGVKNAIQWVSCLGGLAFLVAAFPMLPPKIKQSSEIISDPGQNTNLPPMNL
jgi:magnesium-transporting ATPase (P-type)